MAFPIRNPWQPQVIRRAVALKETGTEVVEVVTNEGPGFVKFLGNPEGPHVLAAEFVGTRLAGAMGLPIFDWHVFHYDGIPEIRLPSGNLAQAGSAWSTRKVEGFVWSGHVDDLAAVSNQGDFAKLVLFDQWVLNCDRYRPTPKFRQNFHNVFFSREDSEAGKFRLLAMDHTHIFTCGGELRPDMARLDKVRDPLAYGLFPGFGKILRREDAVAAVGAMMGVDEGIIQTIVLEVPLDWEVSREVRHALIDFLLQRRKWLETRFVTSIFPQDELF
jgi:hypothetical protein